MVSGSVGGSHTHTLTNAQRGLLFPFTCFTSLLVHLPCPFFFFKEWISFLGPPDSHSGQTSLFVFYYWWNWNLRWGGYPCAHHTHTNNKGKWQFKEEVHFRLNLCPFVCVCLFFVCVDVSETEWCAQSSTLATCSPALITACACTLAVSRTVELKNSCMRERQRERERKQAAQTVCAKKKIRDIEGERGGWVEWA